MITLQEVGNIHDSIIENFGGGKGIRDTGGLESAIHRPYQTFDGQELYPTPAAKAAAIFESVIINHPFVDGNKRTAYVLLRLTLRKNGVDISVRQNEAYDFVIQAAKGELSFDLIKNWIERHLQN